jgi:carbamate kinase
MMNSKRPLAIVAVGGNALIRDEQHLSIPHQYEAVIDSVRNIVDMIEAGWNVVLTHGNGPQVGFILRRSELAAQEVAPVPLDYAVGDTQGAIGYMFQKALDNELHRRGVQRRVVALVTQTRVDLDDPAFKRPAKPVGAFFDEATAKQREQELGWTVMEDAGRGWRRTVPSPEPLEIVERDVIALLLQQGCVVIACGGGGIPVVRGENGLTGVEAVIDKDLASALLAQQLEADLLLIPTGVEQVAVNFGTPEQRWLDTLTVSEARELIAQGQFGAGSMLPKVEAILRFVSHTGPHGRAGEGLITSPTAIRRALERRTGTWITP